MTSATTRRPAWQLELYDVRSTTDDIGDVTVNNVSGSFPFQPLTGPRDFTPDAVSVRVEEARGDYVNGGIVPTTVTVELVDPGGLLDPLRLLGLDPASAEYAAEAGRYLRKGNVVVLRVGDTRVDVSEWVHVFTGAIIGQAGRARGRSDGARSVVSFQAASREFNFSRLQRTSNPFSIGTTFLQAATTIAEEEMGLDLAEIALSGWGSQVIAHEPTQFVEETPLAMLAKLMFADGFLPRFNGRGQLTQISSTITAGSDRIYQDLSTIRRIDRPFSTVEQPSCVTVVGLDADLLKVTQPEQRLATTDITTGYFVNGEEITVFWADDQTVVAENPQARVLKSVNGGLSVLGGGEQFEFLPSPGPGGGTVGVRITVDTGFAPWLAVFLLITYVALAAVPDEVAVVATVPVGRIAQAAALSTALLVMTKIGRGQYEFIGTPIEYVYPEIRKRACVAGQSQFQREDVVIENHLLNTEADCTNAARETLFLLQAEENPRDVEMLHDLRLEPDDIFQVPTGQRYLINTVSYTLTRNADNAIRASVGAFEVTSGVLA